VLNQAIFLRAIILCAIRRNFPRTKGAEYGWNLEATANFMQRDNFVHRHVFDEQESGRCDINGSLRVVERIGFIGAARSELARDLRGVVAMGKFIENPRPIAFGIGVVIGMLSRCD
jgi:hypothetical protein